MTITLGELGIFLIGVVAGLLIQWWRFTNGTDRASRNQGSSAAHPQHRDTRIQELMHQNDPQYEEDDDGMEYASYKRRDKPERRTDWARFLKENQDQDQD